MTLPEKSKKTKTGNEILEPYRKKIDALDRDIIELLRKRYDIIREVGDLKARENLPAVIQDRVDEVRENAARMAKEKNVDPVLVRKLYAQLIAHSCELEEEIIRSTKKAAAK